MGKSVTSALIGTLVADGKLTLDAPPPVPALRQATDGRQAITLKQLLQMKSGLEFAETYGPGDDSTAMLFERDDMAAYAAERPQAHPPGSVWSFSSGTANILRQIEIALVTGKPMQQHHRRMRPRSCRDVDERVE